MPEFDRDAICDVIESSPDVASVADWVVGLLREAKAEGWNNGWDAAVSWMRGDIDYPLNPYELTDD